MKHYEELTGAEGRRVYYRAERYRARDLLPGVPAQVVVEHVPYTLIDLSMSGIAFYCDGGLGAPADVGAQVGVDLTLGTTSVYRGRARISRLQPLERGIKIGAQLMGGYLDVPAMVSKHHRVRARLSLERAATPEVLGIDGIYKSLCADTLFLLRDYRLRLEEFERLANGDVEGDQLAEVLARCRERFEPRWRELWYRANEIVRPLLRTPEALRPYKDYAEAIVTPELLAGPVWKRAYEKPLGYPGDYEVMNYAYGHRPRITSAYGRFIHDVGIDVIACVETRMRILEQTIAAALAAPRRGERAFHVASLGCGPAAEVANVLRSGELSRPVRFTLIDQDIEALDHAYNQTYREVSRMPGLAKVQCLQASFTQLVRAGPLFQRLPPQDLIYSVGLLDYLPEARARELVASLFQQLVPGGLLVVGNVKDTPHANQWPGECLSDWSLIYRSEAEMRALIADVRPSTSELITDPTGKIYLLFARRP